MYRGLAIDGSLAGHIIESDIPGKWVFRASELSTDIENILTNKEAPEAPTQECKQELYQYDKLGDFGIWTIREPRWLPDLKMGYYLKSLLLLAQEGVKSANLLEKYMAHIGHEEGIHFIPAYSNPLFNEDEIKTLKEISKKADQWQK